MPAIESRQFAEQLMVRRGLYAVPGRQVDHAIARRAGGYPTYIRKAIEFLRLRGSPEAGIDIEDVDSAFEEILVAPEDLFGFNDYRSRLIGYHGESLANACGTILDVVAQSGPEIELGQLQSLVAVHPEFEVAGRAVGQSRALFREAFTILERDRYLTRSGSGKISFSFELLRRAWFRMRLLQSDGE